MSFDDETRKILRQTVSACRRRLVQDVTDQLGGTYGLHPDGTVLSLESLKHLSPDQLTSAHKLRDLLQHLTSMSEKDQALNQSPYQRMVLEISFTILNQIAALRLCEERGLIIECVRKGMASDGFRLFERICSGAVGDRYDTYRVFLQSMFDELHFDLGVLFDRMNAHTAYFPTERCMEDLLSELNKKELSQLWIQDETIGWIYQYFNPKEERDAMRKASRSPRNSRELAVRNQFFTPRYVVEFLTDNTLGRIWYDMRKGDTILAEKCYYLARRPKEIFLADGIEPQEQTEHIELSQSEILQKPVSIKHVRKKDPRDLKILDPACGSGHFLLYAFDLLEEIYEEAWSDSTMRESVVTGNTLRKDFESLSALKVQIPKLIIENNLFGVDIDSRAIQIAALALWLRAQRSWKNLGIKPRERPQILKSNFVVAEAMPGELEMRSEFTSSLQPRVVGQLLDVIFDKMKLAAEAGSLLKIETSIKAAIADARSQWIHVRNQEKQLAIPGMVNPSPKQLELNFDLGGISDEIFWQQLEDRILISLEHYAKKAENGETVRRRMFVEDAARGLAFIDVCRQRYDVILMNPPFGASSKASKRYIDSQYAKTKGDLLANFIERSLDLLEDHGRVGAISNRTPFFLGSFSEFRKEVLGKLGHVRLMADLGEGVLEATVETAAYILTKTRQGDPNSTFLRLLVDTNKADVLRQLVSSLPQELPPKTFVINPHSFSSLSGSPYAYWVDRSTIRQLSKHPPIEGNICSIRVGLQTGEDLRYLRLLWEIPAELITPRFPDMSDPDSIRRLCTDQLNNGGHWVPYAKTDVASPWYSPINLVVNWANNGKELRHFTDSKGQRRSVPRSENLYFYPGFSYMFRSTRIVPYLVPAGAIPSASRAQIFPTKGEEYTVLAICASNVGSAVARFSGEKFAWPKFQKGMIEVLPTCHFSTEHLRKISDFIKSQVQHRREVMCRYEPFQEFVRPAWLDDTTSGDTAWDLNTLFGKSFEVAIAEAFGLTEEQLTQLEVDIREAASMRRKSGDEVDTDDETAGSDSENGDDQAELNLSLVVETAEEKAVGLLMYCVGVIFGRWDVRIALDTSLAPSLPDPFDPIPICAPAALVGPDGLPAKDGQICSEEWMRSRISAISIPADQISNPTLPESDYPVRIAWDGILVDDSEKHGAQPHRDDIVRRVRSVLDLLFENRSHDVETQICNTLGIADLYDYFHEPTRFFQDHLTRYSSEKSRRKAPIYWPLSTASGSYTIWLYYHRLNEQTLYLAVNRYIEPKLEEVEGNMNRLEAHLSKDSPRNTAELRDKMSEQRKLLTELQDLRDSLLKIASLPYIPNLNDGVIINAAPLHRWFRLRSWSKDCANCWKRLEDGEYDWTHLAYKIWPLRVREVCKKDRSVAIAHGLEELPQG